MNLMNAVIACGGTGGHLFPGLAVAEVLRARGHEVMLFISEKEIDALALSGRDRISVSKNCRPSVCPRFFRRRFSVCCGGFNESLSLCRAIYRKFKPHAVLGMGGFTSTAPVLAGRMRGVATFIHESNAIPGKGEPDDRADGARGSARVQGMRAVFPEGAHRSDRHADPDGAATDRSTRVARQQLGLREDLPTLLVMGGSQGASGINQAMIKSLPALQGCRCR